MPSKNNFLTWNTQCGTGIIMHIDLVLVIRQVRIHTIWRIIMTNVYWNVSVKCIVEQRHICICAFFSSVCHIHWIIITVWRKLQTYPFVIWMLNCIQNVVFYQLLLNVTYNDIVVPKVLIKALAIVKVSSGSNPVTWHEYLHWLPLIIQSPSSTHAVVWTLKPSKSDKRMQGVWTLKPSKSHKKIHSKCYI